jgi:DHA1 family bicyclomycin/chloramphenicol resistance-like MFS transporter
VARAIVRDLYTPLAGARAMSKALTGLGIVACLCAPVGGLLAEWLGWRAALLALTAYATATLALVALRMPETLAHPTRRPCARHTAAHLGLVLRHPTFWAFSLLTTATYGGLFTFLAASSFVFIEVLGWSRTQYGWVLLSTAWPTSAGTFVCRRLLARWGCAARWPLLAGLLSAGGGTLMALVALAGWQNPLGLLPPFYLFMLAHGIHQPCGQTGAVGPFPQAAGVASA